MKKIMLVGLITIAGFCSLNSAFADQNITSSVITNRYVMFGGSFNEKNSDKQVGAVFKLDTYTGDTWVLEVEVKDGEMIRKWIPVDIKDKAKEQQEKRAKLQKENRSKTHLRGLASE